MADDGSLAEPGTGIGAVILAAGSGTRLGRRPKCLLELNGESLIRRQIGALQSLGLSGIVVVLGHHHKVIDDELRQLDVDCVKQPASEHSQSSSIRLGIAQLPRSLTGYLVCPMICRYSPARITLRLSKSSDHAAPNRPLSARRLMARRVTP